MPTIDGRCYRLFQKRDKLVTIFRNKINENAHSDPLINVFYNYKKIPEKTIVLLFVVWTIISIRSKSKLTGSKGEFKEAHPQPTGHDDPGSSLTNFFNSFLLLPQKGRNRGRSKFYCP